MNKNLSRFNKIASCVLTSIVIILSILGTMNIDTVNAYASTENTKNVKVSVNGGALTNVRVIDISYDKNAYYSLRDLAALFNGTDKRFSLAVSGEEINIELNTSYSLVDGYENTPWNVEDNESLKGHQLKSGNIYINDKAVNYYTLLVNIDGVTDVFMTLNDLCMILNVKSEVSKDRTVKIDTSKDVDINPAKLERDGYFESVNAVVIGDATTGEIYYDYKKDEPFPIASTTKVISFTVLMDAIKNGEISEGDTVTISKNAARLSKGEDRVIEFQEGKKTTVKELMYAMMLPSSNESALANAEHLCGSEEEFVKRMYELASRLKLGTASFYNCHGLPYYIEGQVASKVHNRLSAGDMFKLVSYLLNTYPETTEITSLEKYALKDFGGKQIKNTNPILKNMPEVTGLKTGTTNRAGCCFITSLRVTNNGSTHDLVVVMYGAENGIERGRVSQTLATYAKNVYLGKADKFSTEVTVEEEEAMPVTAEGIVSKVMNTTR